MTENHILNLLKYKVQEFTSSGYFIVRSGISRNILVHGAGGGGGGASGGGSDSGPTFNGGGGGGGGGADPRSYPVRLDASKYRSFAPADVNTSTEVITITGHGLSENQSVVFSSTDTLPGNISAATVYYLKTVTTDTFKISSTPGGADINISSQGSGVHSVETCYVVEIGGGGAGGAPASQSTNGNPGANGNPSYIKNGSTVILRFPGGPGGSGGEGASGAAHGAGGGGGASFNWENSAIPGGDGGDGGTANAEGGFDSLIGGLGAAAVSGGRAGGGGGGSFGSGGAGGTAGNAGSAGSSGAGGGGGAGGAGGGGGGASFAGGAGGAGFVKIFYEEV